MVVFVYKGISKIYKNLSVQYFCSNLSINGLIFARSSLDCHIFSTLSIDTHNGYSKSHKAIWLYGFKAIIWLYAYNTAIKPCGFMALLVSGMGVYGKSFKSVTI